MRANSVERQLLNRQKQMLKSLELHREAVYYLATIARNSRIARGLPVGDIDSILANLEKTRN